jgi:hypothetical protein
MELLIRRPKRARGWSWGSLLLLAVASSGPVAAAPAPTAPATSGGSYTVSYPPCGECLNHWLEERVENGAWQAVGNGSVTFTGKPTGTYYYRVVYFYLIDPQLFYYWTDYGPEARVAVTANAPPVDSLETQLSYRYETRYGDGNGDGKRDIFVQRIAGGVAGNGALDKVMLLQGSGGRFSTSVPTSAQAAAAGAWPRAAIQVVLQDFNVDGFADVLLKGVASAIGVSGALNQIVYAPARVLTQPPLGIRGVDANLKRFAANAHDYFADTRYFEKNAPIATTTVTVWYYACTPTGGTVDYWGSANLYCFSFPTTIVVTGPDYSVYNSSALSTWSNESRIQNGSITVEQGVRAISDLYQSMLGVPIGGRDLRGIAGERGTFDDADYRRGFELFLAVLGIYNANAQELEPARPAGRRPDTVYVTGRRVLGFLPMHTALEYAGSTISAYDSQGSLLTNGRLVSQVNWPSDRPALTMTLGTVTGAAGVASAYWVQLLAADANYDDNLPYNPIPGSGSYNSNGYTHGLIRTTAGTASVDMNGFVGGERPVPASAFR